MKGRTFPQFRLHPDASSVPFHNLFAYRETDARAGIVSPSVKALEYNENALGILRGNANPVVADREDPSIPIRPSRDVNTG